MTQLAPLARQRRHSALASLSRLLGDNVIRVDFRSPRIRPVLRPDLGLRPAARPTAPHATPAFAQAA